MNSSSHLLVPEFTEGGHYSPVNSVLGGQYSLMNNARGDIFYGALFVPKYSTYATFINDE